jgi:hypothetical protein
MMNKTENIGNCVLNIFLILIVTSQCIRHIGGHNLL